MPEKSRIHLNMSLQRIYIFLFFTCIYAFLSFWIATTLFYAIGFFAIFGLCFYVFASLFHFGIGRIIARSELPPGEVSESKQVSRFFIVLIIFSIAYLAGVYWMQGLAVQHLGVPGEMYTTVSLALGIFSLGLSFMLSFVRRN